MTFILITEIQQAVHALLMSTYLASLPQVMQDKSKRYLRWQDQQAYVLGKLLVRKGFEMFNSDTDPLQHIRHNTYGKPFVEGTIDFNISHSGKYVVCICSNTYKVGIDIEEMKSIDYLDFKSQMCEEEWNRLLQAQDKKQEFYHYWTSKEATIKAIGKGLSIPLKSFIINNNKTIVENKVWHLHQIEIDPSYGCHFALDKNINQKDISVFRKNPDQL